MYKMGVDKAYYNRQRLKYFTSLSDVVAITDYQKNQFYRQG
jgi:hypothetical protein